MPSLPSLSLILQSSGPLRVKIVKKKELDHVQGIGKKTVFSFLSRNISSFIIVKKLKRDSSSPKTNPGGGQKSVNRVLQF